MMRHNRDVRGKTKRSFRDKQVSRGQLLLAEITALRNALVDRKFELSFKLSFKLEKLMIVVNLTEALTTLSFVSVNRFSDARNYILCV